MSNNGLISGSFSSDTTLSTPVAINKGGTGQTTAQAALDALAAASGTLVQGDIFIVDSSGNLVRLARGSDDQALVMNGNNPNWEAAGGATVTVTRDQLSSDESVTGGTFADTSLAITCQASGKFIVANQILAKSDSATDQMIFRCVDGVTAKSPTGASSPYPTGYHGVTSLPLTGTCDSQVIKVQFRTEGATATVTLKGVTPFFSAMEMFEVS